MTTGPREINVPFRPIPLDVPEGMKPNEFFNSPENLKDLTENNGLLINEEDLLLYRKALGHSNEFDCSIIYNTSQSVLNPLGRAVRRTQLPNNVRKVWNRMNQIIIGFMLEHYPDPKKHLVLAGEASLDATWPITSTGVPSIRMLHNHFIVFNKKELQDSKLADTENPNLTDGGQHSLFAAYMQDVYVEFLSTLDLKILKPVTGEASSLSLTGYPQGLPSWEVIGGIDSLKNIDFWQEYDKILKGFLDFYRTFFAQVSSRNSGVPHNAYFPKEIEKTLLFNNCFLSAAKKVRDKCINDAKYASSIRWQPAFKQLIYRNDEGALIVTISQNSIGNAITELLGVVVNRIPDTQAYEKAEPALIEKLLKLRSRLVEADLGRGIKTDYWD
ncbi:hypothetical protein [uncultured Candidatus Thioglobus sp.]|jgi:hypothetical protein|uniref:hypothetical protein n=1 Tax=uncultured Candidatus Thioglobus sp. TaxID=655186 RepID=UPI0001BD38E3|nr:MAG: hypothetical protein Sup05_0128 [uncultured Candidatus Thioglobus sp.]MBT4552960.1 hypothetical protein [Candidatus Thioglobus sp.]MBT4923197.1 hypothetical protein [Candidatus Thioglobus sp.]MBT6327806.1 hypothetical protein [Candidatus Thioglobus sp.]